jgi:hypothetical protein
MEINMKFRNCITLALVMILFVPLVSASEDNSEMIDERAAIEAAARDYIDGWYEGNAERMARALHPDLVKRTFRELPNGDLVAHSLTCDNMVAYTRAGFGRQNKKKGHVNKVIILDVLNASASVKTISHEFTDYLHLAKINGQWKIVNVLWEPLPKTEEKE